MLALTAATGQLGRLVTAQLLSRFPERPPVAVVRDPAKAADLAAQGVVVRAADYADGPALVRAFAGVESLLLISGNELGQRFAQHRNVIAAARSAGVKLLVYTSLLRADTTALNLGPEHARTEAELKASGLPYVNLRNGWYTENYTGTIAPALAHGAFVGSAGSGRIAAAARADYADAAVVALAGGAETGRTYELAGDSAFTLADFAAELSRQAGRPIPYRDLPEADYAAVLRQAGLPPVWADGIAGWDTAAAAGALFDEGRQLSRLIGRPTTPLADSIRAALPAR